MTKLRNIRFLNAGYCRQLAYWTGVRNFRAAFFHAVVVYFEHPDCGAFLIDTGYGPNFWQATKRFPFRFYRWMLPTRADEQCCLSAALSNANINPNELAGVFLSHFHPDHIGGLSSLPSLPLILRNEPLDQLRQLTSMKQLHHGFIPELFVAEQFEIRKISEHEFQADSTEALSGSDLRGMDYFGDQSLILVDLPGHSLGHTGFLLRGQQESLFYVVDATWNVDVMLQAKQIPLPARMTQCSYSQYWRSQQQLREVSKRIGIRMVACHCPRTQDLIEQPAK